MGMFDSVNFRMSCPNCGKEISDFQSKDGECILAIIEPDSVDNFYGGCSCGQEVEFTRPSRAEILAPRKPALTKEQVMALGFVMKISKR